MESGPGEEDMAGAAGAAGPASPDRGGGISATAGASSDSFGKGKGKGKTEGGRSCVDASSMPEPLKLESSSASTKRRCRVTRFAVGVKGTMWHPLTPRRWDAPGTQELFRARGIGQAAPARAGSGSLGGSALLAVAAPGPVRCAAADSR